MSQYESVSDQVKWGLVADPGAPSSMKPAGYNGHLAPAAYHGNVNANGSSNGQHQTQWQGIRLPLAPPLQSPSNPWTDQNVFNSGTTVGSSPYLNYPSPAAATTISLPSPVSGMAARWSQGAGHLPPIQKVPHRPYPLPTRVVHHTNNTVQANNLHYLSRLPLCQERMPHHSNKARPNVYGGQHAQVDQRSSSNFPQSPSSAPSSADLLHRSRMAQSSFSPYSSNLDLDMMRVQAPGAPAQRQFWSPPARPNISTEPGVTNSMDLKQYYHSAQINHTLLTKVESLNPSTPSFGAISRDGGLLQIQGTGFVPQPMISENIPMSINQNEQSLCQQVAVHSNGVSTEISYSAAQLADQSSPSYQQMSPTTTVHDINSPHDTSGDGTRNGPSPSGNKVSPSGVDSSGLEISEETSTSRVSPSAQQSPYTLPSNAQTDRVDETLKTDMNDQSSADVEPANEAVDHQNKTDAAMMKCVDEAADMSKPDAAEPVLMDTPALSQPSPKASTPPMSEINSQPVSPDQTKNLVIDTGPGLLEPITPPPPIQTTSDNLLAAGVENHPSHMNIQTALRLEEKILNESRASVRGSTIMPTNLTLPRPPGLVANANLAAAFQTSFHPTMPQAVIPNQGYACPICGFTSPSKFHFNSHMNTHTDHQCTMCDYTARTEGRLKRHMKDFHSAAEQAAAQKTHGDQTPAAVIQTQMVSCEPSPLQRMQQALDEKTKAALALILPKEPDRRLSQSSSKPKSYRCKQCEHVSRSKDESWQHARTHIKPDKLLTCPQCDFVTEYKHHLEYHLRNHFGSKPFRCNKCSYSCVNKSMLNSHMKSHSNYYQYRCSDCTYATKYCHSLKLHLGKYGHRPATIIGADGTPVDPIELYSNRQGLKIKKMDDSRMSRFDTKIEYQTQSHVLHGESSPEVKRRASFGAVPTTAPTLLPLIEALQFQKTPNTAMANSIATMGPHLPTISSLQQAQAAAVAAAAAAATTPDFMCCSLCNYRSNNRQELMKHSMMHVSESLLYSAAVSNASALKAITGLGTRSNDSGSMKTSRGGSSGTGGEGSDGATPPGGTDSPGIGEMSADGSGSPGSGGEKVSSDEGQGENGGDPAGGGSSRRKGKAFKLDTIALRLQNRNSPMPTEEKTGGESVNVSSGSQYEGAAFVYESVYQDEAVPSEPMESCGSEDVEKEWSAAYVCSHCEIAFKSEVMFHIHMGYHGYGNPFRCNRCGHTSSNSLDMFMHISQAKH